MKIITQQLADKLPNDHKLLLNREINPQDYLTLFSVFKGLQQLTIYDITATTKHPTGAMLGVNDHINRTGNNPLIGQKNKIETYFIDITVLYKHGPNFVKTDCCGKKLNRKYSYPSHYLCNISIIAKAAGIQKIEAFLVNFP